MLDSLEIPYKEIYVFLNTSNYKYSYIKCEICKKQICIITRRELAFVAVVMLALSKDLISLACPSLGCINASWGK